MCAKELNQFDHRAGRYVCFSAKCAENSGQVCPVPSPVLLPLTWYLLMKILMEFDIGVWNVLLKFYTIRPIFLFIKNLSVGLVL